MPGGPRSGLGRNAKPAVSPVVWIAAGAGLLIVLAIVVMLVASRGGGSSAEGVGTTDDGVGWEQEMGDPYVDDSRYREQSPRKAMADITTPMLVIHGELDARVPISEGLRLWTDLHRHGVDAKFLYFPDEGHWVLKPQHTRVWYETVLAARTVHNDGMLAFLTYDDEHHRIAVARIPGLEEAPAMHAGTDHTREYVPFLVCDARSTLRGHLGTRASIADVGATVGAAFGVAPDGLAGRSIWS